MPTPSLRRRIDVLRRRLSYAVGALALLVTGPVTLALLLVKRALERRRGARRHAATRARQHLVDTARARELERSGCLHNSLVENLPDMVFVKDARDLKFIRLNRAAEKLLGYSREELLGKSDHDFFPKNEADFFTAKDRMVLATGKLLDVPVEPIHTRNNGLRFLHTKKIPVMDPEGQPLYLLGISEDITEKKLAEEDRDRSRSRVSSLEAERDLRERFVSTLSHDLRAPLATILCSAELMAHARERPELLASLPTKILRSVSRADAMIQELLDVTRIVAGHPLPLRIITFDLALLAADVVADFTAQYSNRIVLETEGPIVGYWCASAVRRALENLVSNAIKHGSPGGAVTVAVHPSDSNVEISVENLGDPIAHEDLATIFEPFRRTNRVQRKGTKGWGLGLTLVRAIAEAHGGNVQVASSTGGTRFAMVLPRDARPLDVATEPATADAECPVPA